MYCMYESTFVRFFFPNINRGIPLEIIVYIQLYDLFIELSLKIILCLFVCMYAVFNF